MFFNRVVAPRFLGREGDLAAADKAERETLPPLLDYLEGVIPDSGFLVGDALTLADLAVASPFANLAHCGVTIDAGALSQGGALHRGDPGAAELRRIDRARNRLPRADRMKKGRAARWRARPCIAGERLIRRALAVLGEVARRPRSIRCWCRSRLRADERRAAFDVARLAGRRAAFDVAALLGQRCPTGRRCHSRPGRSRRGDCCCDLADCCCCDWPDWSAATGRTCCAWPVASLALLGLTAAAAGSGPC